MPPKNLRFNPVVDEYEERDVYSPPPAYQSGSVLAPVLHPALRPGECPQFDFSLPSATYNADPRLASAFMDKAACTPPLPMMKIRILSADGSCGLCRFEVYHHPKGKDVTVGDVIGTIQAKLREPMENAADKTVQWYCKQRARTLEQYAGRTDANGKKNEETLRRVDELLGNVLFSGITLVEDRWEVRLKPSQRYAGR
ncbi:hypothetical protein C8R44DRAFT_869094 [Mycena epipterygia]|nr:hypothetical protein C8R44DRAFT_869094 [Mycena epipterygia]